MVIYCQDSDRQAIVHALAREASLEAAQQLVELGIRSADSELTINAAKILETVLLRGQASESSQAEGDRSLFSDLMPSYLKSVKTVLSKGIPTRVQLKVCKIEDCVTCFYENICERISIEKLIQRSRDLVNSLTEER